MKWVWLLAILLSVKTQAHPSYGLEVDSRGNFYFADISKHGRGAVWRWNIHSNRLTLLLSDFHAHNVQLDSLGRLMVANGEDRHYMLRQTGTDRWDTLVDRRNHLDFFGGNCIYLQDGIIVFNRKSQLWQVWKDQPAQPYCDYTFGWSQALYTNGTAIWATDNELPGGGVIRIDAECGIDTLATNLITKRDRPHDPHTDILQGMTIGPDGHVFVAEAAGSRIARIFPDGQVTTFFRSPSPWSPTGVTFKRDTAYILEFSHRGTQFKGPQIRVIYPDGRDCVVFNYQNYDLHETIPAGGKKPAKSPWPGALLWLFPVIVVLGIIFVRTVHRMQKTE